MPPKKQQKKDTSVQKLQSDVTVLKGELSDTQARASLGRTRNGNKAVAAAEARLQVAETKLREAERALANSAKRTSPEEDNDPPSKRLKATHSSEDEVLDMELDLLDKKEKEREIEAEHIAKEEREQMAERLANEAREAAARMAKEDAERLVNEANEVAAQAAGDVEHLANKAREMAGQTAKEGAEQEDTEVKEVAAQAAGDDVERLVDEGNVIAVQTAKEDTERLANEVREAATRTAREDAEHLVNEAREAAAQIVKDGTECLENVAKDTAVQTVKEAERLANNAKEVAAHAVREAERLANEAKEAAAHTVREAKRLANEANKAAAHAAKEGAERLATEVTDAVAYPMEEDAKFPANAAKEAAAHTVREDKCLANDAAAHAAKEDAKHPANEDNEAPMQIMREGAECLPNAVNEVTAYATKEGSASTTEDIHPTKDEEVSTSDGGGNRSFGTIAARLMFDLITEKSRLSKGEDGNVGEDEKAMVLLEGVDGSTVEEALYKMGVLEDAGSTMFGGDESDADGEKDADKMSKDEETAARLSKGGQTEVDSVSDEKDVLKHPKGKSNSDAPGKPSGKAAGAVPRKAAVKAPRKVKVLEGPEEKVVKALRKVKASDGPEEENIKANAVRAMLNRRECFPTLYLPERVYAEMSEEARKALDANGANQIRVFLNDTTKPIDSDTRLMLRDVPDYLPQSAVVSRDLTCHILTTKQKNLRCLYHIMNRRMDKSDLDVEAATKKTEKGELSLTGVSGWATKKQEEKVFFRTDIDTEVTHLDCGCGIEEALFHYWMWKTWRLRGMGGAVVEPINAYHIAPRLRNVIHQAFELQGGLSDGIETIFGGVLRPQEENREQAITVQLRSLTAELGALYTSRGELFTMEKLLNVLMGSQGQAAGPEELGPLSGGQAGVNLE